MSFELGRMAANGTASKRTASKRTVSKRTVSKRTLSERVTTKRVTTIRRDFAAPARRGAPQSPALARRILRVAAVAATLAASVAVAQPPEPPSDAVAAPEPPADSSAIAVVPVPGAGVTPEAAGPIVEATLGALRAAAPTRAFRVLGNASVIGELGRCADAACRAALIPGALSAGTPSAVLVLLARPNDSAAWEIELHAVSPQGQSLGDVGSTQLPGSSASNPATARAVLSSIVAPVVAQLPVARPSQPTKTRLLVAINMDGAQVTVDGEAAGEAPLPPVEVSPGEHTVGVHARGYQQFTRAVTVPREGLRVDVLLDPTPAHAERIAQADGELSAGYAEEPDEAWYQKWWVWAAIGGGAVVVAALVTAIVLATGDDDVQPGFPVPPIPTGGM